MANGNFNRDRAINPGRERFEAPYNREREFRRQRADFPDWDRYGSYRDIGRADYTQGDRGDREPWQADEAAAGDFGYSDGDRRGYSDSGRGFARRSDYDNRNYGQPRDFIDRASDEVASWFGDDDAQRRREMDQHRGKGPKGYTRTDERIREDVNDRLSDDPMLDASDIEVTVATGEVTLNGLVKTRQDKRRAEDLAEAVSGVNHLQNNLRVKPNSDVTNIVS